MPNLKKQLSEIFSKEKLTPAIHSIYLASSYSADCPAERTYRTLQVVQAAAKLRDAGYCCYSPIVHWHHVEQIIPAEYNIYLKMDLIQLAHHDLLLVLCNNSWEKSYGISTEITFAETHNIPVYYLSLEGEITDDPSKFHNRHN